MLIAILLISLFVIPGVSEQETKLSVNGEILDFDVPPTVVNGRTLVPLRGIFEALGVDPVWNGQTQTVSAQKGNTKIELPIGSKNPTVNGQKVEIDVPGTVINGRTLVPARFIAESLNATVGWDAPTSTVTIRTNVNEDNTSEIIELNDMEVHFIDVGQGDSILIKTPEGKVMLVDGGSRAAGDKWNNCINM